MLHMQDHEVPSVMAVINESRQEVFGTSVFYHTNLYYESILSPFQIDLGFITTIFEAFLRLFDWDNDDLDHYHHIKPAYGSTTEVCDPYRGSWQHLYQVLGR